MLLSFLFASLVSGTILLCDTCVSNALREIKHCQHLVAIFEVWLLRGSTIVFQCWMHWAQVSVRKVLICVSHWSFYFICAISLCILRTSVEQPTRMLNQIYLLVLITLSGSSYMDCNVLSNEILNSHQLHLDSVAEEHPGELMFVTLSHPPPTPITSTTNSTAPVPNNCAHFQCNETPLDPIYITPENVDEVLATLTLPSMETLRQRKKPFSFTVEGIVGTGKTTLLSAFKVSNQYTKCINSSVAKIPSNHLGK